MALRQGMCTALNAVMLSKLNATGISSASDFISRDPETLSKDLQVAYKDICSIRRVLLAEHSAYPVSALTLYQNALSTLAILSTGCSSLDQLLDGGLYTGEVTEFAGDTATGKTRLCHWCAATTVREEHHSVLYIDTCGAFHVGSLLEALSDKVADKETLKASLGRIQHLQVFDIYELFTALDRIGADLGKQESSSEWNSLKLVVVDNLALLVNPIMGASAALNQGVLSRLGLNLKQLADRFSIAVLLTNNLVSVYGQGRAELRKPALGKVWSHVPHTRVILSRVGSGTASFPRSAEVEATLVKSGRQQTSSKATFSLVKADM